MFPALPALFHKELICTKGDSGPSSTPSCGIRDLRGSSYSPTHGERQSFKCGKVSPKASLQSVDAEQILYAWQESDLSAAVHQEVKESEPQRNRKFDLGLHETHFFKHIASRWQHAKMCQVFKYEYGMIV